MTAVLDLILSRSASGRMLPLESELVSDSATRPAGGGDGSNRLTTKRKDNGTTVWRRVQLAIGIFSVVVIMLAAAGWWSARSFSDLADGTVSSVLRKQHVSLNLVASTMRVVEVGERYVTTRDVRRRRELEVEFRQQSILAHESAIKLSRSGVVSVEEGALAARVDRKLSILEARLARAHRHVDLGEQRLAEAQLREADPLEREVVTEVSHLGTVEAQHAYMTSETLRKHAAWQMAALSAALIMASLALGMIGRWIGATVATPIAKLAAHAQRLVSSELPPPLEIDEYPQELRPLASALSAAGETLDRAVTAEETARSLLGDRDKALIDLRIQSLELEAEIGMRRTAEAAALSARYAADSANRAKSAFLANMSHELRTPLNSVIGFSAILQRNKSANLRATDLEYLDRIGKNGRHLLGLVNDVLDLAKIESGQVTVDAAEVRLQDLIPETLSELEGRSIAQAMAGTEPPVQLLCAIADVTVPLQTDAIKLKQMLINLVGNALKFTDRGSVTVAVVTNAETHVAVRIDVVDTGPGIALDRQAAVFRPFEQEKESTARDHGGTGLGLAITASLAEMLGYKVTLQSKVGIGSTFSIHLMEMATT